MSGHCTPGHRDLELCIEIAPEVGADSLIRVYLDEPILAQLTEILVIIKKKVEFQPLHDLWSLYSN
jgi:hypothetical protein